MTSTRPPAPGAGPDERILWTFEHELPPPHGDYRWVFLWHLPIRLMHWVAAISLVVLLVTGALLAQSGFMAGRQSWSFAVQWVRLFHFAAAGVLVATGIVRVYWLFVGNRFERWSALFPVRGRDWVNLWKMVRFYLFVHPERVPRYLGHNPLQQLSFTLAYAVALVMVLTGFVMFGQANPGGLVDRAFGWMTPLLGGVQWVRALHHALAWFFPTFIILHVYLAIRADLLERGGTLSSIVSGGRFVRAGEHHVDE